VLLPEDDLSDLNCRPVRRLQPRNTVCRKRYSHALNHVEGKSCFLALFAACSNCSAALVDWHTQAGVKHRHVCNKVFASSSVVTAAPTEASAPVSTLCSARAGQSDSSLGDGDTFTFCTYTSFPQPPPHPSMLSARVVAHLASRLLQPEPGQQSGGSRNFPPMHGTRSAHSECVLCT
jgi:hypothetical protein